MKKINEGRLDMGKMRGLYQLKADGIDLSTTSEEAGKLWDAILFQLYTFIDAPETNGVQGCIERIKSLDPEFPLLDLITFNDVVEDYESMVRKLKAEVKNQYENKNLSRQWTNYEKVQLKAFIHKLEGYNDLAIDCLLDYVAQHPKDIFGLWNLFENYVSNSNLGEMSNIFTLCKQRMSTQDPFYSCVLGFEAFGLEEKGFLQPALKLAKESLGIYSWNSFATHAVAHIFDAEDNSVEALKFMNETKTDWSVDSNLAVHNNWHLALFLLNEDKIDEALEIFDSNIIPSLNSAYSHLSMTDAVGLLMRLEMNRMNPKCNVDLSEHWEQLSRSIGSIADSFSSFEFYNAFLSLSSFGCHRSSLLENFQERCEDFVSNFQGKVFEAWESDIFVKNCQSSRLLSNRFESKSSRMIPFSKAMKCYMAGDYQTAVNILYPIRKDFRKFGGSKAQNDLFYQILASALFLAGGTENRSRLKLVVMERKDSNQYKAFYRRLEAEIVELH